MIPEQQQGSSALGLQTNLYGSWNLNCRASFFFHSSSTSFVFHLVHFFVYQIPFAILTFLSPKVFLSSITQFIFLLSTRNCYYFAIKSSSLLIDLLEEKLSLRSIVDWRFCRLVQRILFPVIFPRSFSCNWIRFLPCNIVTCFFLSYPAMKHVWSATKL